MLWLELVIILAAVRMGCAPHTAAVSVACCCLCIVWMFATYPHPQHVCHQRVPGEGHDTVRYIPTTSCCMMQAPSWLCSPQRHCISQPLLAAFQLAPLTCLHFFAGDCRCCSWPAGLLLFGPPGCGKTHVVASAVAATGARLISVKVRQPQQLAVHCRAASHCMLCSLKL
jgi:hypothetical protein